MNTTDITDTAEDLKDQAQETANEWKERVMEKAKYASQSADRYVRENVWMTVTCAALAGCAVGFLLGRSRD